MTAPKVGDRVRVEFEGIVDHIRSRGGTHLDVLTDDKLIAEWVPISACTVIAPPVKVGDPATLEVLDALPKFSVVIGGLADLAAQKRSNGLWYATGYDYSMKSPAIAHWDGVTVLHIGGDRSSA